MRPHFWSFNFFSIFHLFWFCLIPHSHKVGMRNREEVVQKLKHSDWTLVLANLLCCIHPFFLEYSTSGVFLNFLDPSTAYRCVQHPSLNRLSVSSINLLHLVCLLLVCVCVCVYKPSPVL